MNRMDILILDRRNGIICQEYIDAQSVLAYFHRTGNVKRFQVLLIKGNKSLYLDKIDAATFAKTLNDFQNS